MRLIYRPIERWPGAYTEPRQPCPFWAPWSDTLKLLDRELDMLHVREDPVLQMALTERDFRLDGSVKANAKLAHPGVILTFEHPKVGPLSYPCDRFKAGAHWRAGEGDRKGGMSHVQGWQANVRAIALGLEALRKVERYGIAGASQQYTGWRALGTGGRDDTPMTKEQAAEFIAAHAYADLLTAAPSATITGIIANVQGERDHAYRLAAKALHPDAGAFDDDKFKRLQEAKRILEGNANG